MAVSQIIGAQAWQLTTPIFALIYTAVLYAHFETRCDNISMDLEAVEDALNRLEPDYLHTAYRFRFKRDSAPDA